MKLVIEIPEEWENMKFCDVVNYDVIKNGTPLPKGHGDWNRLYSWLNDMRFGIAPDETVTDIDERNVRTAQVDLLDEIMEWIDKHIDKERDNV